MRKKRPWLTVGLALLVLAGTGGGMWAYTRHQAGVLPADGLMTVRRGDLEIVVSETGKIQPLTKVDIKSKVSGQVAKLWANEGQVVKRGQVLLELDPTDFKRQLAQVQADRAMSRAELDGLLAGSRREDLAEARAVVAQARARSQHASEEQQRAGKALAAGSLTPREWDTARADWKEASADERAADSKLARLQAGPRAPEIAAARARLAKADVAVAAAEDQLSYAVLRSPIAGTVIHRGIEVGEMVTPGVSETGDRKPLLTVADLSRLVVESNINQIDVGKLALEQTVTIRVDTLPGVNFTGQIHKVAPAAVAGPQRDVELFPVQTLIARAGTDRLRTGMSADLDIFIQKKSSVLLLPVEAVVRERGTQGHVTLIHRTPDGKWRKEKRAVSLGASSDHEVEIATGLQEGEQVLLDPASAKENVNQF